MMMGVVMRVMVNVVRQMMMVVGVVRRVMMMNSGRSRRGEQQRGRNDNRQSRENLTHWRLHTKQFQ